MCVALALSIIFLLRQTAGISRRIMESEYCYMELEPDSLAVCQPEKNGRYESCRIFYPEIDKIVEGSRRGIPEFYVVLRETDQERESFFLLDDEEHKRNIFCVRSIGFGMFLAGCGLSEPKTRRSGTFESQIRECVCWQPFFLAMWFQNFWK